MATTWQVRARGLTQIQRGRRTALQVEVRASGAVVAPDDGLCTVADATGVPVASGGVDVVGGIARFTVEAADTTDLPLSDAWTVTWLLDIGGEELEHLVDASLVRRRLHAPASEPDLYERVPGLDPTRKPIHTQTDFQSQLSTAWLEIEDMLVGRGKRPYLVMSPAAFRKAHVLLTLSIIFEGLAGRNASHLATSKMYADLFRAEWDSLTFVYDENDDVLVGADEQGDGTNLPLFLL